MTTNDQVQKYYDALIHSYDILIDAAGKASDRGTKVTKQFVADVTLGQREALELGKRFAAEPTDVSQYYTAVLEATTAAQGRALAFAQAAYHEVVGAGTETRDVIEKLVAANKDTATAAVEAVKQFTAANPMAETIRRNFEAIQPKAAKKDKVA